MSLTLTRQQLHELVWSEPITRLAPRFGLSDVGFAKACRRARVPVPARGHWARVQAGQAPTRIPLPPRGPGMYDTIQFETPLQQRPTAPEGESRESEVDGLDAAVPSTRTPTPAVPADIQALVDTTHRALSRIKVPKTLRNPHPVIAAALARDEERHQRILAGGFAVEPPRLRSVFEQRRLRILDALFTALTGLGHTPSLDPKTARSPGVRVGDMWVSFTLEHPKHDDRDPLRPPRDERLQLQIPWRIPPYPFPHTWTDDGRNALEACLPEIGAALVAQAEIRLQLHAQDLIDREHEERRRAEDERRAEELEAQRQRIRRLHRDAVRWRRANTIREYVAAVEEQRLGNVDGVAKWCAWAREEADRIDPISTVAPGLG